MPFPLQIIESIFLFGVASVSFLAGFGLTLGKAKKSASDQWQSDQVDQNGRRPMSAASLDSARQQVRLHREATQLGVRALGWGTLYAVSGVALLSTIIWKLSGASSLEDFRRRVGNLLPRLTPESNSGRVQFSSLTDFLQYIIDEDEREKKSKKS